MILAALFLATTITNISGQITLARENLPFYFLTDSNGANWRVNRVESQNLKVGDIVEVSGEREGSLKNRILPESISIKSVAPLLPPRVVSIKEIHEALLPYGNPTWYGARLTTKGRLRDINRRRETTQLLVGLDEDNLQVELPIRAEEALPPTLALGAIVRITGNLAYTSIENLETGELGRIENIELIPQVIDDVLVIQRAPFWSPRRLIFLSAAFASTLVLVGAWALTLRRMVARRTAQLKESIRARVIERVEADAMRRERLRIAADLHDGFQQYLAGAMFRLKAAINYLPEDATNSREQLSHVKDALQHTQDGLRSTLWALNEESEGPQSILELFTFTARRMPHWNNCVEISSSGKERSIVRRSATTLLLIMQEAVSNALKHGKATKVKVHLNFKEKELLLLITDNGCGFEVPQGENAFAILTEKGHYGLSNMARRIKELNGEMTVDSSEQNGTRLEFSLPFE